MRYDADVPRLTLSKRNLLALLHKLEMEGSARTLQTTNWYYMDKRVDGHVMEVCVEPDDEHYRERTPGPMHISTERFIKTMEESGGNSSGR